MWWLDGALHRSTVSVGRASSANDFGFALSDVPLGDVLDPDAFHTRRPRAREEGRAEGERTKRSAAKRSTTRSSTSDAHLGYAAAYNAADDLPGLFDGLLAQSRPPDELVAFDDRSTDDTAAQLDAFAARAPFPVVVQRNERHFGPIEGTERTLRAATGDVIAIHDQADVWERRKLEHFETAFGRGGDSPSVTATSRGRRFGRLPDSHRRASSANRRSPTHLSERARRRSLPACAISCFPIPHHVSLDMWIAVLGALTEECARFRSISSGAAGAVVAPTGGALDRLAARRAPVSRSAPAASPRTSGGVCSLVERVSKPNAGSNADHRRPQAAHRPSEARGTLPDKRGSGFPIIVRELRSGRYNRYSAGVLSALQDLAY